jgi:G3E family GTPase
MTTGTLATSKVLPVSILAGPDVRALVHAVVFSRDKKSRFGVLSSSFFDSPTNDRLMAEQLVTASSGGYDPARIRAHISMIAGRALTDHLLIECDSKTHPIAFASLFLPDGGDGQRFAEIARLSSILFTIDSETLLSSLVDGARAAGVTSACILADQIECADVIVLNGEPTDPNYRRARAVASVLNPQARIVQRSIETTPAKLLDAENSFDFEAAFAGTGWRKLMEAAAGARHLDQGVTTFVYRARRPFHPEKFWNLIQRPFPGVFRAKGFFWLASRMSLVGGLNIAGAECHYSPAGQWWAANAPDNHSHHTEIPDRLKKEWEEPFGDRRQAIAFMGIDLDAAALSAQLDACLLSDSEMTAGEESWAMLPDPFPSWSPKAHDHECEDHDCCHH